MAKDRVSASAVINALPVAIFGVLADPTKHAAIDGTGWVCEPLDVEPLTASGQMFRMAMYHPKHPDGGYQMSNRVQVYDPPLAISWEPGHYADDGNIRYGGWVWRYDLVDIGLGKTEVKLTYDWSAVGPAVRAYLRFPPFPPDHLTSSLQHLGALVASRSA